MTDAVRSAEVGDRPFPTRGRRALALLALLATVVAVAATLFFLAHIVIWLIVALVGVGLAVAGLWWVLTERLPRRAIGLAGLVAGGLVIVTTFSHAVEAAGCTESLRLRLGIKLRCVLLPTGMVGH